MAGSVVKTLGTAPEPPEHEYAETLTIRAATDRELLPGPGRLHFDRSAGRPLLSRIMVEGKRSK